MKLKEYIEKLNELTQLHPEASEFECVYSRDDEGNGFEIVHYSPGLGFYEDMEFHSNPEEYREEYGDNFIFNAVCIN